MPGPLQSSSHQSVASVLNLLADALERDVAPRAAPNCAAELAEKARVLRACATQYEELSDAYQELLFAVARRFPNETRHDTALRYIREVENKASGGPEAAIPKWS